MAARQDQTLQIFLIIFIFLFLVTAVFAYLGWRGYSDAETNGRDVADVAEREDRKQMQTRQTELGRPARDDGFRPERQHGRREEGRRTRT